MLAYCKANVGKVSILIIPKIDRFARQTIDYHLLKRQVNSLGIRLESIGERLEDTPVGRFTESILAATAQFDNEIRAERSKGGMVQAVREGRWVCSPPRGYRMTRHEGKVTIRPDQKESPLIATAFERLAGGRHRPVEVKEWLGSQGIPISRSQFYRMVRNKAYIGVIEMFGLTVEAKAPFVPLVSIETFHQACEAIRPRVNYPTIQVDHPDFPLRGTLRCDRCSHFLTANWSRGHGGRYPYYRCKHCRQLNFRREKVELDFVRELGCMEPDATNWKKTLQFVASFWSREEANGANRARAIEDQITAAKARQEQIIEKNLAGILPDHLAKTQIRQAETLIAELTVRKERLHAKFNVSEVLDFAQGFFKNLSKLWYGYDLPSKKRLQQYFYPDGLAYNRLGVGRTFDSDRLIGLRTLCHNGLSHMVDLTHENPKNLQACKQIEEILETLQELHRLFGEDVSSK